MKLSIVIPVYNEEENIKKIHKEIADILGKLKLEYEVIWVNDGSQDASFAELETLAKTDVRTKVLNFVYNFGQTAAMSAGIKYATGDIIIPMDADLQNDPIDIPKFLEKIGEGYDVVSGWRKDRKDAFVLRKVPSLIANYIIRTITGVYIHDYGCSMKAYRREMVQGINLYGEMHRFIPAYVSWHGGRVTEIVVHHRARMHGETKYGISRTFRVILDLILIKFLSKYMNRPIHFFGGLGFGALFIGLLSGIVAVVFKLVHYKDLVATPLPIFSAMLIIVGVQLIAMGVIAEILMRAYYESQKKDPYIIKDKINI